MVLWSKYGPLQIVLLPEVISDNNLITLLSTYLQFEQNVLLDEHSLSTFASLTPEYGGSFMRVFTVMFFN